MIINKITATAIATLAISLSFPLAGQTSFDATSVLTASKTITGQPLRLPKTRSPEVSSVLVEIMQGGESGRHKHPVSPHIYVIEGVVSIEFDDGRRKTFSAGEGFLEAVDIWHNAKNLGKKPVKMLVVFFGEKGKNNMIRP